MTWIQRGWEQDDLDGLPPQEREHDNRRGPHLKGWILYPRRTPAGKGVSGAARHPAPVPALRPEQEDVSPWMISVD